MRIELSEEIFQEVFEDKAIVLAPELSAGDAKNRDPFDHINLMIFLEDEFGGTLAPDKIQTA